MIKKNGSGKTEKSEKSTTTKNIRHHQNEFFLILGVRDMHTHL